MSSKDLSIITVSYNAYGYIDKWIDSIINYPPHCDYEVLIVDNGSSGEAVEKLKRKVASVKNSLSVKLILNNSNLGFAKANNIAFTHSKGKFLLFVNNDTLFLDHSIDSLLDFIKADSLIGIVGPKILNPDMSFQPQSKRGIPTLWNSFCYFSGLYKIFPKSAIFGGYLQTFLGENKISEVPVISGACMLVRHKAFVDGEGFSEEYFMHFEDIDFCMQAKGRRYKIIYYPNSKIIHFKGGSGANNPKVRLYFYDSMLKFYKKNLKGQHSKFTNWFVEKFILFLVWRIKKCKF